MIIKFFTIGITLLMFFFNNPSYAKYEKIFFDYEIESINGEIINLNDYRNKVILLVNTASYCGFTKQYTELQELWDKYNKKGLIVLGVPTNNFKQEPGSNKEIKDFCETNFNINFPMTEKIDVIGNNAHSFFIWAKENHGKNAIPKWNFHKIIIGKDGKVADTFSSITKPSSQRFINLIEKEIKN